MRVIDIDSHYFEPFEWLEETDPTLVAELPQIDKLTLVLTTAFGEVLSTLPPQFKPDPYDRIPKGLLPEGGAITPEILEQGSQMMEAWVHSVPGAHKLDDRLAFLNAQGIDEQWVLPTFAFNPISFIRREKPELAGRLLSAYNTWACENLAGSDRVSAVTVVDLKTMDRQAVENELKLTRERGSRSFLFWPSPVEGVSLGHPDLDWFWATAADHGLMPQVHVGAGRPNIDYGWLNNGREFPSQHIAYFGQLHQIPELLLLELLGAGTFEKHPNLRIIVAELGIDWLPSFVRRADRLAKGAGEAWGYPLLPSEYLRRQLRVSPLHTDPVAHVIDEVGKDLVVFSTDYPHPEGGANAVSAFREKLAKREVAAAVTDAFFGGTIQADLEAIG